MVAKNAGMGKEIKVGPKVRQQAADLLKRLYPTISEYAQPDIDDDQTQNMFSALDDMALGKVKDVQFEAVYQLLDAEFLTAETPVDVLRYLRREIDRFLAHYPRLREQLIAYANTN